MFGKNKKESEEGQPEMEVIEEEIEGAETELEVLKQGREVAIEEATEDEEVEIMVVRKEDIPMQEVRTITKEDGTKVQLVTTEEALSRILNS